MERIKFLDGVQSFVYFTLAPFLLGALVILVCTLIDWWGKRKGKK